MQKGLCIAALSISGLVMLLFLADILLGNMGMRSLAPLKYFSLMWDLILGITAAMVAYMSFAQFRKLP